MLTILMTVFACSGSTQTAAEPAPSKEPVTLTAAGTEIDPPVHPDAIPDGAYYCDMGTVHYARTEEGDGRCGLCQMKLKKKEPTAQ